MKGQGDFNMFFKGKNTDLKTDIVLNPQRRQEGLSTELTLEKLSANENALPAENEIPFWDEKNIREQISLDISNNYKSVSEFAVECSVDRSLITQWISMKKNISRDRLLCILITLYGNEKNGAGKINDILKSLRGIDNLHLHNARDYVIISGIRCHQKIDEIDETLRNKQLACFENLL